MVNVHTIFRPIYIYLNYQQHFLITLSIYSISARGLVAEKSMQTVGGHYVLRPISAQVNFPRTENFPKISLLKVENFQPFHFF